MISHGRRSKFTISIKWKYLNLAVLIVFLFFDYFNNNPGADRIKNAGFTLPVIVLFVLVAAAIIAISIISRIKNNQRNKKNVKSILRDEVNPKGELIAKAKKVTGSDTSAGIG